MILIAALLAASAPAVATQSRVEADAKAVERSAAAAAPHVNGTWLDGKPGTEHLIEAEWRAVQHWAADWLDAHPRASPKALVKAGASLGDAWSVSAVALGGGDMLVAISCGEGGTAFILGAHGAGGYQVRWSIAGPQLSLDPEANRALALWRPTVQNAGCSDDCRMPEADGVGRLSDSADRAKRFWIEAYYAQEAGATVGEQLSFWSWRDGQVRPLLVNAFAVTLDQTGPVLRGATLHVSSKGNWESLFACGACFGRETDLPFAIGPSRVRALPPVSLTPELDVIDRVFARVLARRPVGALAAPSALRVVRTQLVDRLAETDPQLKSVGGMVMGWRRWIAHGVRWACVSVDGVGATAFAFDRARTRITAARALDPNACSGKGTRS